jgi:predicted transcriptional regulator
MAVRQDLRALAADIVSAYVSNNTVAADQLPRLIQQVFNALGVAEQAAAAPPEVEPAVPVGRSVFPDHIVCLDCGKQFLMLRRHLRTRHNLTPQQYRQKWKLPPSYPLIAPNYAKVRSTLAKEFGLGRKRRMPKKAERKAARKMTSRR